MDNKNKNMTLDAKRNPDPPIFLDFFYVENSSISVAPGRVLKVAVMMWECKANVGLDSGINTG